VGVKGVEFEEVYTLGPEAFMAFDTEKIFGLVFLFKWQQEADPRPTVDAADHGIFFAQQVIQNACATQAILSVLMNVNSDTLDLGGHLKEFKEFTCALDPEMKGIAISNSEVIRVAHNSFKHQSSFEIVQDKDDKGDDAFHFVGYVCHQGSVYELDGLKKGPVLIGPVPAGVPWVEIAREDIQRRIEAYQVKAATGAEGAAELRFNLMAITADRLREVEKKIERERFVRQRATVSLVSRGEDVMLEDDLDDDEAPPDVPSFEELQDREITEVQAMVAACTKKIEELTPTVEAEKKKRKQWQKENNLRRHDLVPLALCAMRHLARTKQLVPAFDKGKAAHFKRLEEKKAAEQKEKPTAAA
jgi:ubiquitin carboxyl-terminal hydrolase L5